MTWPESPCDPHHTPHLWAPQASSPEKQDPAQGEGKWPAGRQTGWEVVSPGLDPGSAMAPSPGNGDTCNLPSRSAGKSQ